MFERIKLRIIRGRELKPFAVAKVLQEHEDRLKALENGGSNSNSENQQQEQQQQSPVTRDLSFTVNDGTDPIEGATISIGTKTGTTGSDGGCTITGIEEGTQSVEVSKTGYTTKTESISVDETHTSFTISLVAEQQETPTTMDLSFTINDGTAPIEGATVTIGAKTGTTGSAGGCTLTGVEEGTQSVEVSATGYTTKTESITVDETHTSFTISLVAEQPSSP